MMSHCHETDLSCFRDGTLMECLNCHLLCGSDHDQCFCSNKNTHGCLFSNSIVISSRKPAFPLTAFIRPKEYLHQLTFYFTNKLK